MEVNKSLKSSNNENENEHENSEAVESVQESSLKESVS